MDAEKILNSLQSFGSTSESHKGEMNYVNKIIVKVIKLIAPITDFYGELRLLKRGLSPDSPANPLFTKLINNI